MPLFRRRKPANAPMNDPELVHRIAPEPAAAPVRMGLARFLPIGDIIKGITGVLRDPNGKISSKRAGAGALITAGIYFLETDRMPPGIVCLATATALFVLTKWDGSDRQGAGL